MQTRNYTFTPPPPPPPPSAKLPRSPSLHSLLISSAASAIVEPTKLSADAKKKRTKKKRGKENETRQQHTQTHTQQTETRGRGSAHLCITHPLHHRPPFSLLHLCFFPLSRAHTKVNRLFQPTNPTCGHAGPYVLCLFWHAKAAPFSSSSSSFLPPLFRGPTHRSHPRLPALVKKEEAICNNK